ncbi:MAG: type II toxin-antitoxin system VapC family toxin [Actinobacteria bacterium]|nr:type II toxin-antitoxin system VapC family toxin [Actinomycetota bacterium]
MILDSSVVVAILLREHGHEAALARLADAHSPGIGAPTLAETGVVLTAKLGVGARTLLARFLGELTAEVVPFGEEHWPVAVDAYRRFGKGRHAAALNFGDCLTYATARLADEPLLALGDDFARTDLTLA